MDEAAAVPRKFEFGIYDPLGFLPDRNGIGLIVRAVVDEVGFGLGKTATHAVL